MKHINKQVGELIELEIDHLGADGAGVAMVEGVGRFSVPKTLPGEQITARVEQNRRSSTLCSLVQVNKPSPGRVEPPCEYHMECGGCHLQHLAYPDQLAWKQARLEKIFKPMGGDLEILPICGAQPNFSYRSRTALHVSIDQLGFVNPVKREHVPISHCICMPDATNELMATLQKALNQTAKRLKLHMIDLVIRRQLGCTPTMLILVVAPSMPLNELRASELLRVIEKMTQTSFYINVKSPESKHPFGSKFLHLHGAERIPIELGETKLLLSPDSFLQIHLGQSQKLYEKALEFTKVQPEEAAIDFYCGIGALTFELAKVARKVIGVEINHRAVEDANLACELNGSKNVSFRSGKSHRIATKLARQGEVFEVATVNPPRTGCERELLEILPQIGVQRLAYVSCSPTSLKRDLALLMDLGFRPQIMQPVDMFPQTYHVETVTLLTRT